MCIYIYICDSVLDDATLLAMKTEASATLKSRHLATGKLDLPRGAEQQEPHRREDCDQHPKYHIYGEI